MKRFLLPLCAAAALSGCVVAPVGPGPVVYRPAVVAPARVYVPPVVVRPGYGYHCGRRGCW
ncbi:hypothetical protein GCM10023144_03050 [Pigmentiphaga soli]|uniref:Lipoprotein n=1 Tax=Pigmentiphaga soli TaxID=1007095 RepID=A0ABP8GE97_9BURK